MLFALLFVLASVGSAVSPAVDKTWDRIVIPPSQFFMADGMRVLPVTPVDDEPNFDTATGITGRGMFVFPALDDAVSFVTATASIVTPRDVLPGVGNWRVKALVHYPAVTNTARVKIKFTRQSGFRSLTTTSSYDCLESADIPVAAASQMYDVDLKTNTQAAVASPQFRPNRYMTFDVVRTAGTNQALEFYGLEIWYKTDGSGVK